MLRSLPGVSRTLIGLSVIAVIVGITAACGSNQDAGPGPEGSATEETSPEPESEPAADPEPESESAESECHPDYDPCLPNLQGDALNCDDIDEALKPVRVRVVGVDPYRLDGNNDGTGCS
jgi:hypothetical protein